MTAFIPAVIALALVAVVAIAHDVISSRIVDRRGVAARRARKGA